MKKTIASAKNFVQTHKTAIVVTTLVTVTTVAVLQHKGIKSLNAFLEEHDLLDTYYHTDEI